MGLSIVFQRLPKVITATALPFSLSILRHEYVNNQSAEVAFINSGTDDCNFSMISEPSFNIRIRILKG
jgi:hypothetical protein